MITKMCIAVANYIISKTNEFNETKEYNQRISMTCKRLQKLLYFSDIEFMKNNHGRSMFKDEFYAWPSGPVIPSVYYRFMIYQSGYMKPSEKEQACLSPDIKSAIDYVLKQTNDKDTLDLVEKAHEQGGPWSQVYEANDPDHKQIIPKKMIYEYYRGRIVF